MDLVVQHLQISCPSNIGVAGDFLWGGGEFCHLPPGDGHPPLNRFVTVRGVAKNLFASGGYHQPPSFQYTFSLGGEEVVSKKRSKMCRKNTRQGWGGSLRRGNSFYLSSNDCLPHPLCLLLPRLGGAVVSKIPAWGWLRG